MCSPRGRNPQGRNVYISEIGAKYTEDGKYLPYLVINIPTTGLSLGNGGTGVHLVREGLERLKHLEPNAKRVETQRKALLVPEADKIMKIVNGTGSAGDKMQTICIIDKSYLGWNSKRWADLLGVSAAAIRQTATWKNIRKLSR